jgi:hypothetical protein
MGSATAIYVTDYDDRFPMSNSGGNNIGWGFGPPDKVPGVALQPYSKNTAFHVSPMDTVSVDEREKRHCIEVGVPYMGWNCAAMTADQKMYGRMARSNIGYNYAFYSPWRVIPASATAPLYVGSSSLSGSEVNAPSSSLMYATSIWDLNSAGSPTGGGNWVVETPCWKDTNGNFLRPASQYAAGTGDGTLRSYGTGWVAGTWLVYGGTWPYYNQTSLANIQVGLKDGRLVCGMADTSTRSYPIKRLTEGCAAFGAGAFRGTMTDTAKFIWDLD